MAEPAAMPAPMQRIKRVHFVGIGGAGMAGIAEVLLNQRYRVSGSDLKAGAATERLRRLGASVKAGHSAANVRGADVVVVSTAVGADNPEVQAARAQRIPVVRRAEMLAELMRFSFGIAIAGTHGKTTTTSLVAAVLAAGGLDPTFVVGGKVKAVDTHAKLGTGQYFVAEADESDASFLHLTPVMAVVTNVDADHLETYGGDFARLRATFIEFLQRLPFYGLAVLCADDPVAAGLVGELGRPAITYGFDASADVRAVDVRASGAGNDFTVVAGGRREKLHLNLPGRHNVQNALAAVVIARELGVGFPAIRQAFLEFQGVGRRCESHGEARIGGKKVLVVDDYGHHPREIAATFEALRSAYPKRRLVVAFQPHRYTRTRDLFDDFTEVLSGADALVLTEVYPAGEARIPHYDGRALARGVRERGAVSPVFVKGVADIPAALPAVLQDGDLLLTLGAGDVGSLPARLVKPAGKRRP